MNRLKELRKLNNLSQSDVGKLLSVTGQAYSNYETGRRSIPFEQIIKLATYYNVTTDYLMGASDDSKTQLPYQFMGSIPSPEITDDFHVSITGPICDEAYKEIQDFVTHIKAKYGYPKVYRGIAGAAARQKELSHK